MRMKPMNPKSAFALSWSALIVGVLGLMVTALSAQFIFSMFAAVLALTPTIFARKKAQIFGAVVLLVSLALAFTGYSKFEQDPYMQRAKTKAGNISNPTSPVKQQENTNKRGRRD